MQEHYVAVTAKKQYAKAGSTEANLMLTDRLDEALIWGSSVFASMFAGMFSAQQLHIRLVNEEDIRQALAGETPSHQWFLGFREHGDNDFRPMVVFPESVETSSQHLVPTHATLASALFSRQVLTRMYGHSYEFQYAPNPFRARTVGRRRA